VNIASIHVVSTLLFMAIFITHCPNKTCDSWNMLYNCSSKILAYQLRILYSLIITYYIEYYALILVNPLAKMALWAYSWIYVVCNIAGLLNSMFNFSFCCCIYCSCLYCLCICCGGVLYFCVLFE
jgi:hypothetical protein